MELYLSEKKNYTQKLIPKTIEEKPIQLAVYQ